MEEQVIKKKKLPRYGSLLKRQIAIQYLEGKTTLQQLSEVYNIPHQSISRWSTAYARELKKQQSRILSIDMTTEEQKRYEALKKENELLKQQLLAADQDKVVRENEQLKKQLEFAEMKTRAMEVIIELAKEELGIDLTKNSGARQPVKSKATTRRQK